MDKDINQENQTDDSESTSNKFSNWKNEPKLKDLKSDFAECKQFNERHFRRVDEWLKSLKGDSPVGEPKRGERPRSRVQPKLVRKNNEWRYAALSEPFNNTPELFRVLPVTFDDVTAAKQNELLLNSQVRSHMSLTTIVDKAVREFVDTGTVILKSSWKREMGEVEEVEPLFAFRPVMNEEELQQYTEQYNQIANLVQNEPDSYSKLDEALKAGFEYTVDQGTGMVFAATPTGEYTSNVVQKPIKNHPYAEVCRYNDIYVDPTCTTEIKDAKFVIHRFTSSIADLKKDSRYEYAKDIKQEDLNYLTQADEEFHRETNGHDFNFNDMPRKKVTVLEYWGYWDINGDGSLLPIVVAWVGNKIIRMEENPYPDGKPPFVCAAYLPERNSIYGVPDAELISDNQSIVGAITRGALDLMAKSSNGQIGFKRGWLDDTNQQKFNRGEDYEYTPEVGHPAEAVYRHEYATIPSSVEWMISSQILDAESVTGVKAFGLGGITGEGLGETAAGARIVTDAAAQRTTAIMRRLGTMFEELGRKFISMNAVYLDEEEVVRITNSTFVPIRKDDLSGNFDLKISVATSDDDAARAQDLAFMYQTSVSQMPQLAQMMLAEYARLKRMPEFAKEIENFSPEPDPLLQEERMAEIELKKAQAALLMAQAKEAETKAGLNQFKAGESEAKTSKVAAEAEAASLDNYERMSGEAQAREEAKERMKLDAASLQAGVKASVDLEKAKMNNDSKERTAIFAAQQTAANKGSAT